MAGATWLPTGGSPVSPPGGPLEAAGNRRRREMIAARASQEVAGDRIRLMASSDPLALPHDARRCQGDGK